MSYVDLHLHLLPGVDDGPSTLRESLDHARRMAEAGGLEAVVTPHIGHPRFTVDPRGVARRTKDLQRALVRAGIGLRLAPGGELHPSALERFGRVELQAIAQGPPGARWVLAEVPFGGIDEGFLAGCAVLRGRGFGVVIAHPERAAGVLDGG